MMLQCLCILAIIPVLCVNSKIVHAQITPQIDHMVKHLDMHTKGELDMTSGFTI